MKTLMTFFSALLISVPVWAQQPATTLGTGLNVPSGVGNGVGSPRSDPLGNSTSPAQQPSTSLGSGLNVPGGGTGVGAPQSVPLGSSSPTPMLNSSTIENDSNMGNSRQLMEDTGDINRAPTGDTLNGSTQNGATGLPGGAGTGIGTGSSLGTGVGTPGAQETAPGVGDPGEPLP